MQDIQRRYEKVLDQAKAVGQQHVLRFWSQLNDSQKDQLLRQLEDLDFQQIDRLARDCVRQATPFELPKTIEPAPQFPVQPDSPQTAELYRKAWQAGEQALSEGKVCAFTVAGGMGTRLGFDGPKGCYAIAPVTGKTLFQLFAEYILNCRRRYSEKIRWYIMTSDANHEATVAFFEQHDRFGLPKDDVRFFQQGMMPAFDTDGRLLLDAPDSLALSPDGHGGSLRALRRAGVLDELRRRQVDHISYFQVDNPLVRCLDPHFVGLHILEGSEMSSKSIPKAEDKERVGNFVIGDGRLMVIEYSDLPDELAVERNADGARRYDGGSIAIHVIARAFVERITEGGLRLPWHRAVKKVPFVDESGRRIEPTEPNAVKLEQFVFDAIPLADRPIVVQTDRKEEFSPVKNATGVDSAETTRRDLVARAARWLAEADIHVGGGGDGQPCPVEISPLRAVFPHDLKG
ncbi:MAG: UDPGP type 1 family protein [Phycisphaerae bacterium]|nr:UDPGP type 1 family protein [Phycisphaerae bacterium]